MVRKVISKMTRFAAILWILVGLACSGEGLDVHGSESQRPNSWSLAPLSALEIPVSSSSGSLSPIDAFIERQLKESRLSFSPAAERRVWLRRVYYDLIGLPPTPEELAAFLSDTSPQAFERVVETLLNSPRYGERWARHWMDAVRYAETHGHDEDGIRENAWPYRDWLIKSLNDDLPYADFVRLQVAGDVYDPQNPWSVAATGFLSCGPWDQSSQMGIQDGTLDKKIAQYLDRDDMLSVTMSTFTSTTVHCARCHDHKFDPIPTEDYYALQAVFAGVDKVDRPFEVDQEIIRERRRLKEVRRALASGMLPELDSGMHQAMEAWSVELLQNAVPWRTLEINDVDSSEGGQFEILEDQSVRALGLAPEKDTYFVRGQLGPGRVSGVRLQVLPDSSLPARGPGRSENGNFHLSEIEIRIGGKTVEIESAVADFDQTGWEVRRAVDDEEDTAWGVHPEEGRPHRAVFIFKDVRKLSHAEPIEVTLSQSHGRQHVIGRFRLAFTGHEAPGSDVQYTDELYAIAASSSSDRSASEQELLARLFLKEENQRELNALPAPRMVYAISGDFDARGNFKPAKEPRPVHVLGRGNVRNPLEPAHPGALSCVPEIASRFELESLKDEGSRRKALAEWLVDPENVLTWRSIVNRVWYHHFGRGLVATLNDFGQMGETPTHPGLLDWLAMKFRDGGGSLKWLHREIVLSRTYRQSSRDRQSALALDPGNRLLWRMNPRPLDAESIRDSVLSLSGMLDFSMGGPSAQQFHTSKGVHVTPNVDYDGFDPDLEPNFRRAVYRFVFRTVPDPLMQTLGCPDASQLTAQRETSTTPLQALALLNNRFMIRQSEHVAASLSRFPKRREQIDQLFLRTYGRSATDLEVESVGRYVEQHGLANACRVIMNSSEFLYIQ